MVKNDTLRNSRSRCDQAGFSMIEMMIAVVVILVGLVSIVAIAAYVARANSASNTLNVLASEAQDQVDRLRTARWNTSFEDPTLAVGGSVALPVMTPMSARSVAPAVSTQAVATPIYVYTLDPADSHRATVQNTPAGDLQVMWQVRQGSTPDLRYVTIRVVQVGAPSHLSEGFMVSTIIRRT